MKTFKNIHMHIPYSVRRQLSMQYLLRNTAAVLLVLMVPSIALASSWSPTLLVNTEAFQTIDDGDGASNIELRFGTTGSGLQLNVNTGNFEFDSGLNVNGDVTASGGLVVEGQSTFNEDATFGSGIVLNGVKYIFPYGDASASGKVLASDGAGNLSWTAAGANPNVFTTISVSGQSDVVSDQASDTLTFVAGSNVSITTNAGSDTITISATDTDTHFSGTGALQDFFDNRFVNTSGDTLTGALIITDESPDAKGILQVIGTASGRIFHAQDELTSSGTLVVDGASTFNGTATFSSITSCTLLTTNSNGQLVCDSEGFDESVDDRVDTLLQSGSGIVLSYDDTNNKLTISQGTNSGSQVSLSPEYAGAVYYGDGSNNVGQMVLAYDSSNKENYYNWTSTQSSLQDYNIAVRVKVPDDFDHWDGTAPIQFRYQTNASASTDNQIDVTMLDTAGSAVSLTGGADLANQSWTTATITGPESSGTYTPGSYITIILAMQARTTNSGEAHAGYLNINWSTRPH